MGEDAKISDMEMRILDILKEKERWIDYTIKRNSDKEFDINIDGERGIGDSQYKFSAWMPLAIIYNADWSDNKIWKLSNGYGKKGYVPIQGYDWSGIRDSSHDVIWNMMYIALRMLGIYIRRR